jgi:branched-chain amino acid aminotransferase
MARADLWFDGRRVRWDDARANVLSHAMQRGSLVFDVGPMREGADGVPRLFRPADHVARLLRSAALVGLEVPWSAEALLDATLETARASGARSALVRWSAFVATPEADVVPRAAPASVAIAVLTPEDSLPPGVAPVARPAAMRVTVPAFERAQKAPPAVFPPHAKVAASYLGPMLAKRAALADGYDEVVLLDCEGALAEAPTSNVFVVRGGAIATPPLARVLPGITRDTVLQLARAEGIAAREAPLSRDDLAGADEAFLTASSFPVMPIASVDGRALAAGCPGAITSRLRDLALACERGEDPRFAMWTVEVR